MSLHNVAKHLAAHGRSPDTMLVHMTPGEVASLQSLAQQHGGSLTTNPHTGLPEAGFLSALLPMAAGAGLAAMGMPAGYAALAVGATSAATNGGDLKKGLMNGISAYGGAGMAESFMGAGLGTMGGTMGASAATPTTVLEAPAGATSPYALTGSSAAPSTAGYSLGEPSSYLNKSLPSLVSTAPAEAAQAAAAATPAAQAATQSAALNDLTMGQRWDALKAGASGTNAMNYIKANPFTSLGVGVAAMTPDENKTPQKAADTDRGARANMQYHPGWSNPTPKPNMQGIEQTYGRPYYAAEGGITHMAEGGSTEGKDYDGVAMSPAIRELLAQHDRSLREIQRLKAQQVGTPPAPLDQKQLFADYLKRVSSGGGTGAGTGTGTGTGTETETTEKPALPFLEAPVASNTRGGKPEDFNPEWTAKTDAEKTEYYAQHPIESGLASATGTYLTKGLGFGALGMGLDATNGAGYTDRKLNVLRGIYPVDNNPLAGGPFQYTSTETPSDSSGGLGVDKQTVENMGRVPAGISLNDFTDNYRMYGEGAVQGNGAYASPVPSASVTRNDYATERGAYLPGATLNESFGAVSDVPSGPVSVGIGALSSDPATRLQQLVSRDENTNREAISVQAGNDGGGHDWGGGGEGAATGGNNGDASGGGDRGTRGGFAHGGNVHGAMRPPPAFFQNGKYSFHPPQMYADGGELNPYNLGSYSDGGRLLKGPGDGVSDSIPATIGKGRPARLANNEFVIPARIVSEIGNGSTDAGARALYKMMDRVQQRRSKTIGRGKVAVNSKAYKELDKL